MASTPERSVRLRSGEGAVVRCAVAEDASALCDLYRDVDATTDFFVTQADERDVDPESRARWLGALAADPGALVLLAEVEDLLVGSIDCRAYARRRMAHVAALGMQVRSGWRGRGVGTALLEALLDWARAHPTIEKVALGVFSTNARAIALYRRLGFVEEGRDVREYRLGPGRYADNVRMALFVKPVTSGDAASPSRP
jgi:RimJ/RimL family protein N-acetyltransferase